MKTISYYISMVVILAATIFTGCTDDDEKSLSPRAGELSIYDFAPNTGKGGTQLLINGEQFPLDATSISVSINEVQLSILRSNEEQLLVEVPDNEAIGTAPIVIKTNGKTTQSEVNFIFQSHYGLLSCLWKGWDKSTYLCRELTDGNQESVRYLQWASC